VFNPLAIGVTLCGLLLDIVVPRPKPRVGAPPEPTLLPGGQPIRGSSGTPVLESQQALVAGGNR
jgi:hypothetical protein